MTERTKLNEGKTKIIWSDPEYPHNVLIESKDDLTAGDGAKHDVMESKAGIANRTTCNVFQLLASHGIPTHFLSQVSKTSFTARRAQMIPIECIARRRATGSFLHMHPEIPEGTRFDPIRVEFHCKDDNQHDPLMVHDFTGNRILLFDRSVPFNEGLYKVLPLTSPDETMGMLQTMRRFLVRVHEVLEHAWSLLGVELIDFKIEFGWVVDPDGTLQLVVADVIDNDSWRIWPAGDKAQDKSKQVYRDAKDSSPETMAKLVKNYAWVAEQTQLFLQA